MPGRSGNDINLNIFLFKVRRTNALINSNFVIFIY